MFDIYSLSLMACSSSATGSSVFDWHLHDHPKHSPVARLQSYQDKFSVVIEVSPLSLAVQPAGGLGGTQGKLWDRRGTGSDNVPGTRYKV